MSALKVIGIGSGGVDEMREALDEEKVMFGLLYFRVGSGTFARVKHLFVHFNGDSCSGMKKGRANAKKGEVISVVGSTHAEVGMEQQKECTLDGIWRKVQKVFVSDDGSFTISSFKADYERMIQEAKARAAGGVDATKRKTAKDMGIKDTSRILTALRKPVGPFNWGLFKPTQDGFTLHNAGSASVEEMREWLDDGEVLAGLLRMGFGKGQFRRTKWVSFWWSGEGVSAVKRGKANQLQGNTLKALEPFALTLQATHESELTLKIIIDKVKKSTVVDGDGASAEGDGADPYSMEAFLAALNEEMEANKEFFGADESSSSTVTDSVEEAVKLIRADNAYNWGLFAYE